MPPKKRQKEADNQQQPKKPVRKKLWPCCLCGESYERMYKMMNDGKVSTSERRKGLSTGWDCPKLLGLPTHACLPHLRVCAACMEWCRRTQDAMDSKRAHFLAQRNLRDENNQNVQKKRLKVAFKSGIRVFGYDGVFNILSELRDFAYPGLDEDLGRSRTYFVRPVCARVRVCLVSLSDRKSVV